MCWGACPASPETQGSTGHIAGSCRGACFVPIDKLKRVVLEGLPQEPRKSGLHRAYCRELQGSLLRANRQIEERGVGARAAPVQKIKNPPATMRGGVWKRIQNT